MKIERLEFAAYGCFTNMALDFAGAGRNMVVVHGPNEAGKSTALNAIRHWLFGFENRPKKEIDFIHPTRMLRILGTVSAGDQSLTAIRRKGNKDTLLAADNKTPLKEGALDPFLKSITARQFEESFGLNLDRLADGGRDLAAGKGDLGEALFSAASGVVSLQKLRASIGKRKDALFSARGANPVINAGLREYADAEKAWKANLVPAKEAVEAQKAVDEAKKELDSVVARLAELRRRARQLGWLSRARTLSAKHLDLARRREPLAGITPLRPDFAGDHAAAVAENGQATTLLAQLAERLRALDAEIAGIAVDQPILAEAEVITRLTGQLEANRKREKDLSEIGQLLRSKKGEAKQSLRNLRLAPDDLEAMREKLRLSDPEKRRLRQLATDFTKHSQTSANAERDKAAREINLTSVRAKLAALKNPGELEALQAALEEVGRARDPEGVAKNLRQEINQLTADLETTRARLGITLDERAIATTRMPGFEEIAHHREQLDAIDREIGDLGARRRGVAEEIAGIEAKIALAEVSGTIPRREDLREARAKRDSAWELIRRAWLAGEYDAGAVAALLGEPLPPDGLARAYAGQVRHADELGDRLEREADRVRELAQLRSHLEEKRRQQTLLAGQTADAERRRETIRDAWRALWSPLGVTPKSPREMTDWRRDWDQLAERNTGLTQKKAGLARMEEEIDALGEKIRRGLLVAGETAPVAGESGGLNELTDWARRKIKAHEKLATDREALERKVAEEETALRNAEANLTALQLERAAWEKDWAKSSARLVAAGIPEIRSDQIDEIIDEIAEFFTHLDFIRGKAISEANIKSELEEWEREFKALAERLGEPAPLPHPGVLCAAWQARLKLAEAARDRLTDRRTQRETLAAEHHRCEAQLTAAGARLQRLVDEARVESAAELPELVTRSAERAEIDRRMENEYRKPFEDLATEAGILPVELERQGAEAVGRDLPVERADADAEIERLDQQRGECAKKLGEAEQRHHELSNRRGGIDDRERMETALARVRQAVPDYATLTLAEAVLARAIERYREQNKSDLFATASRLFARLTSGRFAGLEIEQDDTDTQFLVGLRPDGMTPAHVPIDGMSDGTRDQLYLALRLAHLSKHVADHGPFPIIVDDLLLAFDDERSRAALHCLAELSRDTQVIFFTHHDHLRRMVEEPEFRDRIGVLEMGTTTLLATR